MKIMNRARTAFLVALALVVAGPWAGRADAQTQLQNPLLVGALRVGGNGSIRLGERLGGKNGAVLQKVHNISGSSISAADFLCYDAGPTVAIASSVTIGYTSAQITVTNDLTTETGGASAPNGGFFTVVVTANGTVDADTVKIWGKDEFSVAQACTLALDDGATSTSMAVRGTTRLYWTDIDSLSTEKSNGGSLTDLTFTARGYATVIASDGANTDFAGVAIATIADNATGFICIYGPVDAVVDAATTPCSPGSMIELAANGDGVVDAAATTAQNVARALEYSNKNDFKIRVFVAPY